MSDDATWIDAGSTGELTGSPRALTALGRHVLVAMVDGRPTAVDNACLHRGASLAGGVCRDGVITCPSHWWRYDLRTGELLGQPGAALRTYPSRVTGDRVEVLLTQSPPVLGMREILLAHARSERTAHA